MACSAETVSTYSIMAQAEWIIESQGQHQQNNMVDLHPCSWTVHQAENSFHLFWFCTQADGDPVVLAGFFYVVHAIAQQLVRSFNGQTHSWRQQRSEYQTWTLNWAINSFPLQRRQKSPSCIWSWVHWEVLESQREVERHRVQVKGFPELYIAHCAQSISTGPETATVTVHLI